MDKRLQDSTDRDLRWKSLVDKTKPKKNKLLEIYLYKSKVFWYLVLFLINSQLVIVLGWGIEDWNDTADFNSLYNYHFDNRFWPSIKIYFGDHFENIEQQEFNSPYYRRQVRVEGLNLWQWIVSVFSPIIMFRIRSFYIKK
jgi:hypothetical protein